MLGFIACFIITHSLFLTYHIWKIENQLDSIATLMEKTEIPDHELYQLLGKKDYEDLIPWEKDIYLGLIEKANQIKKTN